MLAVALTGGRRPELMNKWVLILVAVLLTQPVQSAEVKGQGQRQGQCVILLHGLWRTSLSMKALQWYLESAGYATANQSYPSLAYTIEDLAEMAVADGLHDCKSRGYQGFHFVTHSLGGILLRQYLDHKPIPGLQRVVMLGPPNRGSQLADYIQSLDFLAPVAPAAVAQLGTGAGSLPLRLGAPDFELGVIAGTLRQSTLLPGFPDEVSDGTVALSETPVDGMKDFLDLPVSHTFMMWNPGVLAQVVFFLEHGEFDRSRESPGSQGPGTRQSHSIGNVTSAVGR